MREKKYDTIVQQEIEFMSSIKYSKHWFNKNY